MYQKQLFKVLLKRSKIFSKMEALNHLDFLKDSLLKEHSRNDGRSFNDSRPIRITEKCFKDGQSSSLISLGKTIIATKIVATPQPIAPSFNVVINRSAVSLVSGKGAVDQTLSAFITVLVNKLLPMSELEIARPDPHNPFHSNIKIWGWNLKFYQTIISDDGGVEVASVLGIQNTLQTLELPNYNLDDEAKLVDAGTSHKINILSLYAKNFSILTDDCDPDNDDVNKIILVDPTSDEEKVAFGCCTAVYSNEEKPKLLVFNTTGKFAITEKRLDYISRVSTR